MSTPQKDYSATRARLVLAYSPEEARFVKSPVRHALSVEHPGRTVCGKNAEGWRPIYAYEVAHTVDAIGCNKCRRALRPPKTAATA